MILLQGVNTRFTR